MQCVQHWKSYLMKHLDKVHVWYYKRKEIWTSHSTHRQQPNSAKSAISTKIRTNGNSGYKPDMTLVFVTGMKRPSAVMSKRMNHLIWPVIIVKPELFKWILPEPTTALGAFKGKQPAALMDNVFWDWLLAIILLNSMLWTVKTNRLTNK